MLTRWLPLDFVYWQDLLQLLLMFNPFSQWALSQFLNSNLCVSAEDIKAGTRTAGNTVYSWTLNVQTFTLHQKMRWYQPEHQSHTSGSADAAWPLSYGWQCWSDPWEHWSGTMSSHTCSACFCSVFSSHSVV